jgi:hypothetical protein
MSLSSPSTFLCVAGSCTVVDKNAHTIGARQSETRKFKDLQEMLARAKPAHKNLKVENYIIKFSF